MITKCLSGVMLIITLWCIVCVSGFQQALGQVTGQQQIRFLKVGALHQWFSNGGVEIEFGRNGRG